MSEDQPSADRTEARRLQWQRKERRGRRSCARGRSCGRSSSWRAAVRPASRPRWVSFDTELTGVTRLRLSELETNGLDHARIAEIRCE
ncbi:hypothetical protein [Cohnella rhizosphaerae]|uniref:Uncharacterized protein n=1 Tax=Cohnella rhizosphaerae TaxID=1457232 RepID=A0A9X4KR13_9BACL|nr:hypothetical protein [Cohnella rhizosphaerae]MDG0808636.1 hypothetical protein [Cohnella rhizosphaerae]